MFRWLARTDRNGLSAAGGSRWHPPIARACYAQDYRIRGNGMLAAALIVVLILMLMGAWPRWSHKPTTYKEIRRRSLPIRPPKTDSNILWLAETTG